MLNTLLILIMGGNYSYLKIKVTDYTAGFIFEIDEKYKKIVIAAGHPDKSFNDSKTVKEKDYNNYGDWYYYDGRAKQLNRVLGDFDPKKEKIDFLIARLKTECNLEEYRSTWSIIMTWVEKTWEITKDVVTNAGPWLIAAWFGGKAITS